ncbi:hypothetical protein [Helicobacter sp. 23-1045]
MTQKSHTPKTAHCLEKSCRFAESRVKILSKRRICPTPSLQGSLSEAKTTKQSTPYSSLRVLAIARRSNPKKYNIDCHEVVPTSRNDGNLAH